MFRSIFNSDNPLFKPFGWLVDIVMLSLCALVPSFLLLPFGAAATALYDSAAHCLRRGEQGPYARFFRTLKESFLTGALAGLAALAIGAGLYRLHGFVYARADTGDRLWGALYAAFWVVLAVANGIMAYWFPLLSRFRFGLGGLLSTGVRLAMAHLPSTAALGVLTTVCLAVGTMAPVTAIFLPCLWALGATFLLEPVFRPYVEAQSGAGPDGERTDDP